MSHSSWEEREWEREEETYISSYKKTISITRAAPPHDLLLS
jgi:hypothetical protein